jgi:hypothetical protein
MPPMTMRGRHGSRCETGFYKNTQQSNEETVSSAPFGVAQRRQMTLDGKVVSRKAERYGAVVRQQ